MAEIFDVVGAAQEVGVYSLNMHTITNFLVLNEEYFNSGDFDSMIAVCEEIRENYTDPYAERVFRKTAAELTEEERKQMWRPESDGGLPMAQRREICEIWTDYEQRNGYVTTQDYDVDGYAVFYHGIREGDVNGSYTGISFETKIGEKPATISFGDPLPVIPPTDGLVNTGWVNYYGETVTSTAFSDLLYSPTFKAVWEKAPDVTTTDHTVYRQEGGKWVKKHEEVTEVYQNKGGQWVKVSPVDAQ